jgi:DNA-binding XRE family transcriptional regulator
VERNIRELRMLTDWSQSRLALKTGIDRTRLSFIENGYLVPSPKEHAMICRVLLAEIDRRAQEFRAVVSGVSPD